MPRFNISEILEATEGRVLGTKRIDEFCGISIDSRTIRKGELFVALRGDNFDGHDFVKEVLLKGASGAVISKGFNPDIPEDFVLISVKDTLAALKDIASFHRSKFDIPLIGVTGSNGKTTTKEMIYEVLSSRHRALKTRLNNNNQIGISLAMLNLDSSFDVAIAELGINHYGEMEVLRKICHPSVAVFTNIGCSHLEFFDTPRNVLKAKMDLIDCFGDKDVIVINADDNLLKEEFIERRREIKTVSFGMKENADFKAMVTTLDNDGIYFEINGVKFFIPVLGLQNIYNALAAAAVGSLFGVTLEESSASLKAFKLPPMRTNVLKVNNFTLIDDTYNSNPDSVRFAIDTLNNFKSEGRKIFVCGDMLELGNNSEFLHSGLGALIARSKVDILLTVGRHAEKIYQRVLESKAPLEIIRHFTALSEVSCFLNDTLRAGDVILIKGSRSMHMEEIVKALSQFRKLAVSPLE